MGFIALVLLIILILLFLLILSLLLIPVDISVLADKHENEGKVVFRIIWGLAGGQGIYRNGCMTFELLAFGYPVFSKESKEKDMEKKEVRSGPGIGKIMASVPDMTAIWPDIRKIFRAVIRSGSIKQIECDATFGLSDPAATGMLYGWFSAIRPVFMSMRKISVKITPVFDRTVLDCHFLAAFRFNHILFILLPVTGLFMKSEGRGMIRKIRSMRTPE